MTVTITPVEPYELGRRFTDTPSQRRDCQIELDLESGQMYTWMDKMRSPRHREGFLIRVRIPILTARATNLLLEGILPHAERIVTGWTEDVAEDGTRSARLGEEAEDAKETIESLCSGPWAPKDMPAWWPADLLIPSEDVGDEAFFLHSRGLHPLTDGVTPERLDRLQDDFNAKLASITGDSTDEHLEKIEAQIITALCEICASDELKVTGLRYAFGHIRSTRARR